MPALFQPDSFIGEGGNENRYKVHKKIGEGRFAEVYEVEDVFKDVVVSA